MSDNTIETCQGCGEILQTEWDQCPVCFLSTKTASVIAEKTCPQCQKMLKASWKQCPWCKTKLSGWKTPPQSTELRKEQNVIGKNRILASLMQQVPQQVTSETSLDIPVMPGDILEGRYEIIEPLGKGGFSSVYRVQDTVLHEDMALKIMVADEGIAHNTTDQLIHEFKLQQSINDLSHIVKTHDPRPCTYKGLSLLLLPMELADGGSLRQWLMEHQDSDQRQSTGLQLFRQACLGVKAIHGAGLVHLDIKPENILLVAGKAKIADFGLGRYGASQFAQNPDQLLRQGIGTPQYMSPEQFQVSRQKEVGPASDIYSLGIILFELLDSSLPFDGDRGELHKKHLHTSPPKLTGYRSKGFG